MRRPRSPLAQRSPGAPVTSDHSEVFPPCPHARAERPSKNQTRGAAYLVSPRARAPRGALLTPAAPKRTVPACIGTKRTGQGAQHTRPALTTNRLGAYSVQEIHGLERGGISTMMFRDIGTDIADMPLLDLVARAATVLETVNLSATGPDVLSEIFHDRAE